MDSIRKLKIYNLLKGIETGNPDSVKVVNEQKYIQHNPQTKEGGSGLAELFSKLAKTNPKVEIVRLFEDGDFVFGHTIYNFSSERIGFEIFKYEGDQVVEHWDNIQMRVGDMVGGQLKLEILMPLKIIEILFKILLKMYLSKNLKWTLIIL
ncbi:MAG: putative SnoaL-like aldol condensation-catalyzing enzyme [Bacteriovoracaceae bacterium]|jgi:predicted SnoaL-like aldol condensation-catalyzing enzyme